MITLKPSWNNARSNYSTRNQNDLDIPKSKTEHYAKSFFPSVSKTWNQLPQEKRSVTQSVENFKESIKKPKVKATEYFLIGERKLNILLTRLRLENPDLNHNLFIFVI